MQSESPLVKCGLPAEDLRVIAAARGSEVRGVLFGEGMVDPTLHGGSGEFSVSSLALDLGEKVLIAAEAVDFGPRAEIFRLRVFAETSSPHLLLWQRIQPASAHPPELDLGPICEGTLQPIIMRFRNRMTAELVPGVESHIDVVVDGALLFIGPAGAKLLVQHDHEVPLSLRVSTSEKVIERTIARASELVVI